MMEQSWLARSVHGYIYIATDKKITGVSFDSRDVKPGDVFFALRGSQHDGHEYAQDAFQKGAVCAVVERKVSDTLPQIIVSDSRKALIEASKAYLTLSRPYVVAITGSVGKSSTKELTATALSQHFNVVKAKQSYNTDIGLAKTILDSQPKCLRSTVMVLEMGMQRRGEIAELCWLAQPLIGVITRIGTAHLEYHGTRQSIAFAKSELLDAIDFDGAAVINADDDLKPILAFNSLVPIYTFGRSATAHFRIVNAVQRNGRLHVDIDAAGEKVRLTLNAFGVHSAYNACAALSVAYIMGVDLRPAARAISEQVHLLEGRLQPVAGLNGSLLLNDTYNSNPESLAAALEAVATYPRESVVVLLGDMLELGEASGELHRNMAVKAASVASRIYYCGAFTKEIEEGVRLSGKALKRLCFCKSLDELVEEAKVECDAGKVILVKASHAAGFDRVVEALRAKV